jgi:hypothetical protein
MSERSTVWRRTGILIAVFVFGGVFDRFALPALFRDEVVYVIGKANATGCRGDLGVGAVRFGRIGWKTDAVYSVPCEERISVSDTVQLHCQCPATNGPTPSP